MPVGNYGIVHSPVRSKSSDRGCSSFGNIYIINCVEALSSSQETAMTATVNRAFRHWSNVDGTRRKASLLNDVDYLWKKEDTALLRGVAVTQTWNSKEHFLDYVRS